MSVQGEYPKGDVVGSLRSATKEQLVYVVVELVRRAGSTARTSITGPEQAYQALGGLGLLKQERLVGLYLDAQNGLLSMETISSGSLNTTRSHPREIFYPAIINLSLSVILAHNHPSGCLGITIK